MRLIKLVYFSLSTAGIGTGVLSMVGECLSAELHPHSSGEKLHLHLV
jgi:hypothetical protein